MKSIIPAAAMLIGIFASGCASAPPLQTVGEVDLKRYAGTWYEIARYPNFFQRGCASDTTAEYTPRPDGTIGVVNQCLGNDGREKRVSGTARVVPGSKNAKLRVTFFWPFAGDYWIIGLDRKDYSWALVGHPSRKFLWILARDPSMPDATYERVVALAVEAGYDPSKIIKTVQNE